MAVYLRLRAVPRVAGSNCPPAVDQDLGTGAVGTAIRGEKRCAGGDFPRLSDSSERRLRMDFWHFVAGFLWVTVGVVILGIIDRGFSRKPPVMEFKDADTAQIG